MGIDAIFEKLFAFYKVHNMADLASIFEVTPTAVTNWKKRNAVSAIKKKCRELGIYNDIFGNIVASSPTSIDSEDAEIIENSIRFRLEKKHNHTNSYFQNEILLIHNSLEQKNFTTRNQIVSLLETFRIPTLNTSLMSEKHRKNAILFIMELTEKEIVWICENQNEFLSILWEYRNLANKLLTFDNKPEV
jgi:hypothetical protein